MVEMLETVRAENEDVIEVSEGEGKGTEQGIHEALKRLSRVAQAERHVVEFEKSKLGDYRRFRDISWIYGNLEITFLEVKL